MKSDEQSSSDQARPPAETDEERLKRQCRDLGLNGAPIFDPASYNGPTDPVTATAMQIASRKTGIILIAEFERLFMDLAKDGRRPEATMPKRGRGRPALRREAEPATAAGFGIIGRTRELSKGERRLRYYERLMASPARPDRHFSRSEMVRELVDLAHRKQREGETEGYATLLELFLNAEPKSIEQSMAQAIKERSERSN